MSSSPLPPPPLPEPVPPHKLVAAIGRALKSIFGRWTDSRETDRLRAEVDRLTQENQVLRQRMEEQSGGPGQ